MTRNTWPCLDFALVVLLAMGTGAVACRGETGDAGDAVAGEAADQPLDGEGMEPRIVTEHPEDAPGRPADTGRAAVAIDAAPGAAWVPHLTASDLEASVEFYRRHGFEVGTRAEERVELARDGVRLVLVAAPGGGGEDGAPAEGGEDGGEEVAEDGAEDAAGEGAAPGDGAAAAKSSTVVLHLVDDAAGEGGRTVRDPDGHRVALPGGG